MIMVGANSVLTTKVIRENTRMGFTEVAVAVEEIGNSMTLQMLISCFFDILPKLPAKLRRYGFNNQYNIYIFCSTKW